MYWPQNIRGMLSKLTFILRLSSGHRANTSTANVIVAKACQTVGNLDAKHTDAKIAAFKDNDCETLQK